MSTVLRIAVIGKHTEILATVGRIIDNREGWKVDLANTVAELLQLLAKSPALVLLTNGLSDAEEACIRTACRQMAQPPIVLQHYGGGSGLLYSEIQFALDSHLNR